MPERWRFAADNRRIKMPTEQQIRELAYSIWEQEGRPHGKDWEHYYTAQRILEEREAAAEFISEQEQPHTQYPRKATDRPARSKNARPIPPYR
jgi:hypothetical protein